MCKLWHALSLLNRKMSRYKIVEPLEFQQFLHSKLLYPHHPKNKKNKKPPKKLSQPGATLQKTCLFCSPVVRLRKSAWSLWGDCVALWSVQGLNTNMSEAGDDWEFYWRRRKKKPSMCSLMLCSALSFDAAVVQALGRRSQREKGGGGHLLPSAMEYQ